MKTLSGLPVSSGVAVGPLYVYRPPAVEVIRTPVADVSAEQARYDAARETVARALGRFGQRLRASERVEEAEIFDIQMEFLSDSAFGHAIRKRIADDAVCAEAAVAEVGEELEVEFAEIDDEYFAQRLSDIRDLVRRLTMVLCGVTEEPFTTLEEPVIVFAHDLTPSDTANMDRERVMALITEVGSATSHTAILSRSLGIPSVVGLGAVDIPSGTVVAVDADEGRVVVEPDEQTIDSYQRRRLRQKEVEKRRIAAAASSAKTIDGHHVAVFSNIGGVMEADTAKKYGAEGVGLLRSEFLFLNRVEVPSEEEQYRVYRSVADRFEGQTVVVRTLDVGGDKPLPSIPTPQEQNPFLGQRAIRLVLTDQERLLIPQLKALLRAAAGRNVKVLFPMVSRVSEVKALQAALAGARTELHGAGVAYASDIQVGVMVEIPSVAINARHFAPLVDFFSIGTNDLTQYTLAADRTNERVAQIADHFDPAILNLIRMVVDAAHGEGIPAAMCGEMAGDPLATSLLIGLGVDELSMSPSLIPHIKERIRSLSLSQCRDDARRCLRATSVDEVKRVLSQVRNG